MYIKNQYKCIRYAGMCTYTCIWFRSMDGVLIVNTIHSEIIRMRQWHKTKCSTWWHRYKWWEVLHSYSAFSMYAHAYSCLPIQPCPFQEPLPVTSGGQLQTETRTSTVLVNNQSHTYGHTYIHTYTSNSSQLRMWNYTIQLLIVQSNVSKGFCVARLLHYKNWENFTSQKNCWMISAALDSLNWVLDSLNWVTLTSSSKCLHFG